MSARQTSPLRKEHSGDNRRSDDDYQKSEDFRLSQIIHHIYEGLSVSDENGNVVVWNKAMEELTGMVAREVIGKPIWEVQLMFLPRESRTQSVDRIRISVQKALQTGEAPWVGQSATYEYEHTDGSTRYIESRMNCVKTNRGFMLVSTMQEITERKRSETALRTSEVKFRSVIAQAEDGIILVDESGIVQEWNMGFERMTGIARHEALERSLYDLSTLVIDEEKLPKADKSFSELYAEISNMTALVLKSGSVIKMERELQPDDKPLRFLHLLLFPITVESENLVGGIIRDVTELKSTERAFRRQADQLDTLRRAALDISAELGLETLLWLIAPRAIELMNGAAMALYLHNPDTDLLEVAITMGDNQPPLEPLCQRGQGLPGRVWDSGEPILLEEYHTGRTEQFARSMWGKVAGVPLIWGSEFMGVLFVFSDVSFALTDLKLLGLFGSHAAASIRNARMHREMHELAITDSLTGIFNRHHFFELAESAFSNAKRYKLPLSALMIDLDFFKHINDTYGHLAGDDVLRVSIERCAELVRETDIFGRYGGEEFIVLLPETEIQGALILAERLRQSVADKAIEARGRELSVTASFGVAELTDEFETLQQLINQADRALYKAKDSGRNRVCA